MATKKKTIPKKTEVKEPVKKERRVPTRDELRYPHHPSIHEDGMVCLLCNRDLPEFK